MMFMLGAANELDRHEVGNLTNTFDSEKARNQDICFRQIKLSVAFSSCIRRRETEKAPFLGIE
jgi:hypothetical protein